MFIIVEGPDGAGKSTFVQELAMQLWRADHGTVLINPKRSPRQPVLIEYKERLGFYKPGQGIDLILDRCWYSDDVYGPKWRGHGLAEGELNELEDWAANIGAVVALLDKPNDVLADRLRIRGDEDVTPEDVGEYAAHYREQFLTWRLPVYHNPDPISLLEAAVSLEVECS